MRNLIVEFIGTFFLALTAALSGNALAIGVVLMVMVYAGGHISGGHYNPAVTAAVFFRGRIKLPEALQYIAAQFAAAVLAVIIGLVWHIKAPEFDMTGKQFFQNLTAEVLGTFALAYVMLNVATTKKLEGNPFYGAAIGLTVLAMAAAFGQAFNPAVALAIALLQKAHFSIIFSCLIGSSVAAFGAAIVVNLLQGDGPQALQKATPPPVPPQV
ncbi:MAG: aquaporin [Verrucomicrobiales bacterium]|nr:aquaporin [Verrucomicrobiales bacterium]